MMGRMSLSLNGSGSPKSWDLGVQNKSTISRKVQIQMWGGNMTKSRDENSNVSNAPKVGELEANSDGTKAGLYLT